MCGCAQLKEDTIALAAGAVTAMLAANAAAAGPMDSPEKVCYTQTTYLTPLLSSVSASCTDHQPPFAGSLLLLPGAGCACQPCLG